MPSDAFSPAHDPDPPELEEAEPASELIEPGRTVPLDFALPELGPGERALRFAYRLGLPIASPFRKASRLRLLATVANPLPGDPVAGAALRAGHFLLHGAKLPIADIDYADTRAPAPFQSMVHGFTWLDDLAASGPREACAPVAERILAGWLAAHPRPDGGPAWNVENTGRRLLAWLAHAPLLLSSPDKGFRAKALGAIRDTARWLDRHVHRAEDRLAEVAGWCGIVAAGLLLPEGKARRLYGEAGLLHALGDLIGDDGGVLSRSPLAQIEAIELLVRLIACYHATRRRPPAPIERMRAMLIPPLLGVLHGDGGLASWQGASASDAARIEALVAASGVRAEPLKDARQWGYQRIAAGGTVLMLDAAPPPAIRNARDGCASTLAIELSDGAQRLIVSCGGAALAGGLIPARLAEGLRATAAHSTLVLDDSNSTAVQADGRLGEGVSEVKVDRRAVTTEAGEAIRIEASHDGYVARQGFVHRRVVILRDDGAVLLGQDYLEPTKRRGGRRSNVPFAIRFHLGARIEPHLAEDGASVLLQLPSGGFWQFSSAESTIALDDSLWVDGQSQIVATRQLVIQGTVPRAGGSFAWLLEKLEEQA